MPTAAAQRTPIILLDHPTAAGWLRGLGFLVIDYPPLTNAKPDAIWLDAARDGLAQCARLRAAHPAIPILLSVENHEDAVHAAFAAGADDVFTPVDTDAARIGRLKRLLAERTHSANAPTAAHIPTAAPAPELAWWDAAIQGSPVPALLVDAHSSAIVDANDAALRFYGYPREQMRAMRIGDLEVETGIAIDQDTTRSYRHRLANGRIREVKLYANRVELPDRALLLVLLFDNSKRREAEASETSQRLFVRALRETTLALTGALDLRAVLDRILAQIAHVAQIDSANIMLLHGRIARLARWRGYEGLADDEELTALRLNVYDIETFRWTLEHRATLVIANTRAYADWKLFETTGWIRSYMCAPIRLGSRVIGFVNADSMTPNRFTAGDGERLQALADQAAIAIHNARLYRRLKREKLLLERRVRERTADLRAERERLQVILDGMVEGVVYCDFVNRSFVNQVVYVNQGMIELAGYSAEDYQQHGINLFRSPGQSDEDFQRELNDILNTLKSGKPWTGTYAIEHKDGRSCDIHETSTPIISPNGAVVGAVSVLRDVSRERALERERANFVAYASHELRTPITNLKTRLYLAHKQRERLDDHLRVMSEVVEWMQRLVDELLTVSRFEQGVTPLQRQPVRLDDLIAGLVELQKPEAERKGQSLNWYAPDYPVEVSIDAERIRQVVTNLITNAINYTPPNGTIGVRLSVRSSPGSRADGRPNEASIEVIDTGIGIAAEHLPFIFQPFYRVASSVPGTGLGLSIAREIVRLHGGHIEVASKVGSGSRFIIRLPLEREAP
jgi:PAS domain S-box-containing protein